MVSSRNSLFRDNLGIKLLSLALAVLLEIYFYSPDNSLSASIIAGVEFGPLPPSMMVVEPPNSARGLSAEIQVRGPKSLIDQVRSSNHRFRITVPPGVEDEFTAILDVEQLSFPTGVEAVRVRPERIRVRLEKEVVKELLVVADKTGEPVSGYRLKRINIFPDSVVVRGPRGEVEALQAVETVSVDVSKVTSSTRREVSLKSLGAAVSASVTLVTLDIEVEPIPQQRAFAGVDVEVIAPEGVAASVQPSRVNALIEGPVEAVKNLSKEQLKLVADARQLSNGRHELTPTSQAGGGITVLKTEPAKVIVSVEASPSSGAKQKTGEAKALGKEK